MIDKELEEWDQTLLDGLEEDDASESSCFDPPVPEGLDTIEWFIVLGVLLAIILIWHLR